MACLAKQYGGLGILDLRDMNNALLLKWWWKFKDNDYHSSWKTLIQFLYHGTTAPAYISPFWHEILQLSELGSKCVQYSPGHISQVRFWEDIWLGQCALSSQYPQLYANCLNPHVLFQDVINTQGEAVIFIDILTGICLAEWNAILHTLSQLSFTHQFDKLAWRWTASGHFSVHSLYLILNYRGVLTEQPLLWWFLPLPPKIKKIGRAHV